MLATQRLEDYRSHTFRLSPSNRISTKSQAIDFVNQRGFIFFWPIKDICLPSLWIAVAGNRPVASQHDDPGHITWSWKDSLLGSQEWYYAKVLRRRATIISMDVVPLFYALSNNYGSPEQDYLTLYERGRMTLEAKSLYQILLSQGKMDTIALRRAMHMTSKESDSRFNRALVELQVDFKILPVNVTQSGGWRYAFAYDLVTNHYPDMIERSKYIDENAAREKLLFIYLQSVGAASFKDITKIFGWIVNDTNQAADRLEYKKLIQRGLSHENQPGEWIALQELS